MNKRILLATASCLALTWGCAYQPAGQHNREAGSSTTTTSERAEPSELPVAGATRNIVVIPADANIPAVVPTNTTRAASIKKSGTTNSVTEIIVTGARIRTNSVAAADSYMARELSTGGYFAPPPFALPQGPNTERYGDVNDNPVRLVAENPVSTFSIDVDTGSYANIRRFLNMGQLPPSDAVRIEEMINYFSYDYAVPEDQSRPFSLSTEVARSPWNEGAYLLRIGLKGYEVPADQRPAANLVFLLDVSGSMNLPNKLPLLVASMKALVGALNENDRVSIVVYAGAAGVVLDAATGAEKGRIAAALDMLRAGGSTAGGDGIRLAYALAEKNRIEGGINRILLATDGDFNVGVVNTDSLKDLVSRKRKSGTALSVLGFGAGNLNDELAEQLADVGDGNYAYIDTLREARKVLVEEMGSTLHTIAMDTKIQVEFNPAQIAEYRLIGYSNRMLKREDFNNDKVDAGDIGAGHTVTALYEVVPVTSKNRWLEPLRYENDRSARSSEASESEIAHVRLRYKLPGESKSRLLEQPLSASLITNAKNPSGDMAFAAAVAGFGETLRGGRYIGDTGYSTLATLAQSGRGDDLHGRRAELVDLIRLAESLDTRQQDSMSDR